MDSMRRQAICRLSWSHTSAKHLVMSSRRTRHDLVNLTLIGKQLHWAVVGQLFRPLHHQLDELVDS